MLHTIWSTLVCTLLARASNKTILPAKYTPSLDYAFRVPKLSVFRYFCLSGGPKLANSPHRWRICIRPTKLRGAGLRGYYKTLWRIYVRQKSECAACRWFYYGMGVFSESALVCIVLTCFAWHAHNSETVRRYCMQFIDNKWVRFYARGRFTLCWQHIVVHSTTNVNAWCARTSSTHPCTTPIPDVYVCVYAVCSLQGPLWSVHIIQIDCGVFREWNTGKTATGSTGDIDIWKKYVWHFVWTNQWKYSMMDQYSYKYI